MAEEARPDGPLRDPAVGAIGRRQLEGRAGGRQSGLGQGVGRKRCSQKKLYGLYRKDRLYRNCWEYSLLTSAGLYF